MASTAKTAQYPTWLACEERQAHRVAVAWEGVLCSIGSAGRPCRILDFTHLGCRVQVEEAPSMGSRVGIVIPAFAEVVGWIAWRADGQAGIDFAHPLPDDLLQDILVRNSTQGEHGDPSPQP